ncbi:MAG: FAD-dependent oxidoreductase, partial [Oscillospiraceae bacterium]
TERYDSLVLSPGASPIRPKLPGIENDHVFTLRNIPDVSAIDAFITSRKPASCAVIGAGFIGMEMAENLLKRGLKVSVIEAASHVMAPIDGDMAHEVHNYARSKGIDLYLEKLCTGITDRTVLLDDGTEVSAELVLMSVGVMPETAFLKGSGLALGRRGEILVNDYLETSVKDVYALGDAASTVNIVSGAAGLIPLAGPANKQARIVADNICGRKTAYSGSQGTSIMKFFDMTVACTGEKEEALKKRQEKYLKSITFSNSHAGYYPGSEMMGIKLIFTPKDGLLLGAQIVGGKGVDKRIDDFSTAIRLKKTVYDLQELEFAYAPPFSAAKDPVNMAGYTAANILEGRMAPYYAEEVSTIPPDALRVDVRTAEEYDGGHIDGFVNIPLEELRQRIHEFVPQKKAYITCQIGLRGYIAQRILAQRGFEVKNLSGGYQMYAAMATDTCQASDTMHEYTHCGMLKN